MKLRCLFGFHKFGPPQHPKCGLLHCMCLGVQQIQLRECDLCGKQKTRVCFIPVVVDRRVRDVPVSVDQRKDHEDVE